MIIIVFSSSENVDGERLLGCIRKELEGQRIEVHRTEQTLCDRFHSPVVERTVMILVPGSRDQLRRLISMGHLFNDNPILLVLPDREPETVSLGHKLYPRFVTSADRGFSDLLAVLGRLIPNEAEKTPILEEPEPDVEAAGERPE